MNQAATLPWVRSTEIVFWRTEIIIVVISTLSVILPKADTHYSGRLDGEMEAGQYLEN
jgi:hypothetical protein